jgi:PadR family transcriptional regulator PadR
MFSPELKKGSLELIILTILNDQPRHGYDIGRLIESRSGGRLLFRVTTLYPVLYRMESQGWIKSRWVERVGEQRRNYYRLTPKGERILAEQRETWREFSAAINLIIGESHA